LLALGLPFEPKHEGEVGLDTIQPSGQSGSTPYLKVSLQSALPAGEKVAFNNEPGSPVAHLESSALKQISPGLFLPSPSINPQEPSLLHVPQMQLSVAIGHSATAGEPPPAGEVVMKGALVGDVVG